MSRVLVVDDDPGTRSLVARMLTRDLNADVAEAANGLEALDLLSREAFSLVLLDIRMPNFDGVETLHVIRQSPGLQQLPVCMMTVDRKEESVHRAIALGVADFVVKPINPRTMVPRIARLLADSAKFGGPSRKLRLDATTRVMVVDENADFRAFFVNNVSPRCRVTECVSGVDALKKCLRYFPDAVFVSSSIGILTREALVAKIRAIDAGNRTLAVALVDEPGDRPPPDDCDAALVRTLDPAEFWPGFTQAVGLEDLTFHERSPIVREAVAAVRQVCSSLLNLDVAVAPLVADDHRRDWCSAHLEITALDLRLAVEAAMPVGVLRETLAAVRGTSAPSVVGDEEISATVRRMAEAAAERLRAGLRQRGMLPQAGESVVSIAERSGGGSTTGQASGFAAGLTAGGSVLGELAVWQV
jgi:CheY-like chemotaxis protein